MLADAPAKLCDFDVLRMDRVGIECRPFSNTATRPVLYDRAVHHIKAHGERLHFCDL